MSTTTHETMDLRQGIKHATAGEIGQKFIELIERQGFDRAERDENDNIVAFGAFDYKHPNVAARDIGYAMDWMKWVGGDDPNVILSKEHCDQVFAYLRDCTEFVAGAREIRKEQTWQPKRFSEMSDEMFLASEGCGEVYGSVTAANGERVALGRYVVDYPDDVIAAELTRIIHSCDVVEGRLWDLYTSYGAGLYDYLDRHQDIQGQVDGNVYAVARAMNDLFPNEQGIIWGGQVVRDENRASQAAQSKIIQ